MENGSTVGNNCVYFARSVSPDLPTGLLSYEDKVNKLLKNNPNATSVPQPGAIGVMSTGKYPGHVFVVKEVYPDGSYRIGEANWIAGQYGERILPANKSTVAGFWVSPNLQTQKGSPVNIPSVSKSNTSAPAKTSQGVQDLIKSTQKISSQVTTPIQNLFGKLSSPKKDAYDTLLNL